MDRPLVSLLPVFVVTALASCGGAAGEQVRPKDFSAKDALGASAPACTGEPKLARPLIIDLEADARVDLEAAMKKGVVVVAYDCNSLRVLSNCRLADGGYEYEGVDRKEVVVRLKGADELKVNLPMSAAKLGGEVQSGRTIDLGLVYVGRRTTLLETARRAELKGACDGATHYLQIATVGAFSLATGSAGKVAAVADLFGVGATGKSESSRSAASSDGSLEACRKSDLDAKKPPAECGSALRVELTPILTDKVAPAAGTATEKAPEPAKAPKPKGEENPCRTGYVFAEGICTKSTTEAFLCEPTDPAVCKAQCEKGSAGSCLNYGVHLYYRAKTDEDHTAYFKKACEGGNADGCAEEAAQMIHAAGERPRDLQKPFDLAKKACDKGSSSGCFWAGIIQGAETAKATFDPKGAFHFYERGCRLGSRLDCRIVAESYVYGRGVAMDKAKGLDFFSKACQAGDDDACQQLVTQIQPSEPDRAIQIASKVCNNNPEQYACMQAAETLIETGRHEEALPFAKKACDVTASWCVPLVKLVELGKGPKMDPAATQALIAKMCANKPLLDNGADAICKKAGVKATPKPKGKK